MSIWSNLAQEVSKVFNDIPVIGKIPVVSDIIGGTIGQAADDYEANKAWNKQTGWQKEMAKYQNDFNAAQSELQRNWSAEQSSINRDFITGERLAQQQWQEHMSDPSYQIGRMLAAGISPAGFDGNQSVSAAAGSVPGMPQGSAAMASGSIGNAAPVLGADIRLKESQAALNNAQAESVAEDTSLKKDTHSVSVETAKMNLLLLGSQKDLTDTQKSSLEKQMEDLEHKWKVYDSEILKNEALSRLTNLEGDLKEKEIASYAQRLLAELNESDARIRVSDAQCKELISRVAANYAAANASNAAASLYNEQARHEIIKSALTGLEFEYQSENKNEIRTYRLGEEYGKFKIAVNEGKSAELHYQHHKRNEQDFNDAAFILSPIEVLAGCVGRVFGANVNFSTSMKR